MRFAPVIGKRVKENYYFDNAATTWPKPEPVYQFMDSFFRSHGVNPGRSGHTLAVEAEQMIFSTRRLLAEFFGFTGDVNRVVFTQNATDSLNMALRGVLQSGDHVISSRLEHNAVLRTVNHLQRDSNVTVTLLDPDANGYTQLDAVENSITSKTKAIVLNHASNVIGTVQNVKAVAELARRHNVLLIIDSAQTAGVVDIDMGWGIDILTFTGHKGLYGPMGVGGMIVGEDIEVAPSRVGGTGVDSISPFQPDVYPHRLEAGTLSLPGVAGLNAAQKWFAMLGDEWGDDQGVAGGSHREKCLFAMEHIHHVEMQHTQRIWQHLQQFDKAHTMGRIEDGEHIAVVSFTVDGMSAQQMAEMLDADYHICVRAGLHCAPQIHQVFETVECGGAIRISPGYFTESEDVDHLLQALTELLA